MLTENGAEVLFGKEKIEIKPVMAFDERICLFLDLLSKELRNDSKARMYSDIRTFGFYIRKANIEKLRTRTFSNNEYIRFGRGMVFHIAPSNIPINFAFSWAFGLLSGNCNVVKVSSKRFEQTEIICDAAKRVLEQSSELSFIQDTNQIVIYERDRDDITSDYIKNCDARVIWGGDATISKIRSFECKPRCVEIAFADRYSFAVFDTNKIYSLGEKELDNICHNFYNDTYLVDQNACSSPQTIFWIGDSYEPAMDRFFNAMAVECKKYELSEIAVGDKYEHLCKMAAVKEIDSSRRYGNAIYAYELNNPVYSIEKYRGKCGEFFCVHLDTLEELPSFLDDEKIQTCISFGIEKEKILALITDNGVRGVDRIVDVGQALDLDSIWDGYDVVGNLSRIISV